MKAKKLVLCLLLSVALVVTFIPMVSFAEGEAVDEPAVEETAPAEGVDAVVEDAEEPAVEESEAAEDNIFDAKGKEDLQQGAPKGDVSAKAFDEGATATLELKNNRTLVCDYDSYNPYSSSPVNFPMEGDEIIISYSNGDTKTYVCERNYGDFYCGDEALAMDYDPPEIGKTTFAVYVWDYNGGETTFNITINVPVTVISNVKSISFSPASITVFSEDIAEQYDGHVYYNLWNRHKFSWNGYTENSAFDEGDSITVNYTNGQSKVYNYRTYVTLSDGDGTWDTYDCFVNGGEIIDEDETIEPWVLNYYDLLPGQNNTVRIMYLGAVATVNVFVDTPALRAQRAEAAAEAARQGIYSASMPAAKASKPKAAKKAITVKWKKLKKKQLKSGVSNIEVWVSTNTAFARGATIEKMVGKKKASVKIKGLQKGVTYYAKVRTIKYVNGQKIVGKWSGVKKVKVKK